MTSRRQMRAKHQNALRSTGPKTPDGRGAFNDNVLRHGVLSKSFVSEHEGGAVFEGLLNELVAEFVTKTAMESVLIERLAVPT